MNSPSLGPVDDAAVQAYYARDQERDRLDDPTGRLEYLRTLEVVGRTLPPPPAVVADIGGGPGRYTDHLLAMGYRVIHRDVVGHHVEQVRARHPQGGPIGDRLDTAIGDARSLDLPDRSVDTVLLLGPLYHLPDRADRLATLAEAARILRPGGRLHAAAISRRAALLDGVLVNRVDREHPQILTLLDELAETGLMRPLFEGSFNGYTHLPDELRAETIDSGLQVESLVSLEGIGFALGDLGPRLEDPEEREHLMFVLRSVEEAPDLLGVGPHLLVTAQLPTET